MASLFYDKSRRVIRQLADLPLSGSVDTGSEQKLLKNNFYSTSHGIILKIMVPKHLNHNMD